MKPNKILKNSPRSYALRKDSTQNAYRIGGSTDSNLTSSRHYSAAELDVYRQRLDKKSNELDRAYIDNVVAELADSIQPSAIFIILESASYFDKIGDTERAIEVANLGMRLSELTNDTNLKRKAHNTMGAVLTRACDYGRACAHLEIALTLAIELKNELYEFATLCNVVGVFADMGLFSDAKNLAMRLLHYPKDTDIYSYLHFQNACNGLRLSSATDDFKNAELFAQLGNSIVTKVGALNAPWKAYFSAQHCRYLLRAGKLLEAKTTIESAVNDAADVSNLRVNVTLQCAKAYYAIQTADVKQLSASRITLIGLLEDAREFSCYYEDLLRALVESYKKDKTQRGKAAGLKYLRQLNMHLVNVKHRQFFEQISRNVNLRGTIKSNIVSPYYSVPINLTACHSEFNSKESFTHQLTISNIDHVQSDALNFRDSAHRNVERRYRSSRFDIAEDWAVAGDFSAGKDGSHCFQVGRLCGLIAERLGLSKDRAVLIEMACRLHDIGKVAVDQAMVRSAEQGEVEDFRIIREHTLAGARLLSFYADEVFLTAARVARHHHEWWNGSGYPDALSGVEIPIEARICAVADVYVALLYPPAGRLAWDHPDAARQVIAMAGVQLDPGLMVAFVEALQESEDIDFYDSQSRRWCVKSDSLAVSKQSLLSAINRLN